MYSLIKALLDFRMVYAVCYDFQLEIIGNFWFIPENYKF